MGKAIVVRGQFMEQVDTSLKEHGHEWKEVVKASGYSHNHVMKMVRLETKPSYDLLEAIASLTDSTASEWEEKLAAISSIGVAKTIKHKKAAPEVAPQPSYQPSSYIPEGQVETGPILVTRPLVHTQPASSSSVSSDVYEYALHYLLGDSVKGQFKTMEERLEAIDEIRREAGMVE